MSRIRISLPSRFSFTASIPIRITDLNYGNHVGNDAVLSILHEARMQFLMQYGYTELNCGGIGLIMSDVGIEFKKEIFYGDVLQVQIAATNFSSIGFDLYYHLRTADDAVVATAKTGMICYDYAQKKIVKVPTTVQETLSV